MTAKTAARSCARSEGGPCLRPATASDAAAIIALIESCWSEYPNLVLDIDADMPELRAPAAHFAARGGMLWVAEDGGKLIGSVAAAALAAEEWEIAKMYVARAWRGTGLAARLLRLAEDRARAGGARRIQLWSDTRFAAAHRFYEKHGYVRSGPMRALNDTQNSLEFGFAKPLTGVVAELLDAAAAASACRKLAELATAEGEKAVLADLAATIATGRALALAGWSEGQLAGFARLDLPATGAAERAVLSSLIVASAERRKGLGRALLSAAEGAAHAAGRGVLVAQCPQGGIGERFLRRLGWWAVGSIPNLAGSADVILAHAGARGGDRPLRARS